MVTMQQSTIVIAFGALLAWLLTVILLATLTSCGAIVAWLWTLHPITYIWLSCHQVDVDVVKEILFACCSDVLSNSLHKCELLWFSLAELKAHGVRDNALFAWLWQFVGAIVCWPSLRKFGKIDYRKRVFQAFQALSCHFEGVGNSKETAGRTGFWSKDEPITELWLPVHEQPRSAVGSW